VRAGTSTSLPSIAASYRQQENPNILPTAFDTHLSGTKRARTRPHAFTMSGGQPHPVTSAGEATPSIPSPATGSTYGTATTAATGSIDQGLHVARPQASGTSAYTPGPNQPSEADKKPRRVPAEIDRSGVSAGCGPIPMAPGLHLSSTGLDYIGPSQSDVVPNFTPGRPAMSPGRSLFARAGDGNQAAGMMQQGAIQDTGGTGGLQGPGGALPAAWTGLRGENQVQIGGGASVMASVPQVPPPYPLLTLTYVLYSC
jgi:hypothetical protein